MLKQILIVALGGAGGSVLRFLTSTYMNRVEPFPLPIGTLTVNVVGCFLIGYFANMIPVNNLRLLLITGFCGGFTTFSTFASENMSFINNNQTMFAVGYTLLSIILGFLGVFLGLYLSK